MCADPERGGSRHQPVAKRGPAGDRVPATAHGFKDATTDSDVIAALWKADNDFNIGLPTGVLFDVIDVDIVKHPHALQVWLDISERFEVDAIARTPGGVHYYVLPTGRGNQAKINGVEGLDYRGAGGYVVGPPSRRPDGRYWWESRPSPRITRGWDQGAWEQSAVDEQRGAREESES